MIHTDPGKRHEFVFVFDVENGNPNGDPDAGNLPRIDPETMCGLVTDVALKRKIRDYVAGVLDMPIFIQSKTALNTLYFQELRQAGVEAPVISLDEDEELFDWLSQLEIEDVEFNPDARSLTYSGEAKSKKDILDILKDEKEVEGKLAAKLDALATKTAGVVSKKTPVTRQKREQTKALLWEKYFDIRMFGAVLTAGTNAGQVRGPVQMTFARSVDPILPMDIPITRVAITKEADRKRKQTEIGRKAIVPYGLYMSRGFYNPYLADQTGVTSKDLEVFWEALEQMFTFDRSAARGMMQPRCIYVFSHDDKKGNAHAHKLFDLIKVPKLGGSPRSFTEYETNIQAPPEGPLPDFPGVTLTRLV